MKVNRIFSKINIAKIKPTEDRKKYTKEGGYYEGEIKPNNKEDICDTYSHHHVYTTNSLCIK